MNKSIFLLLILLIVMTLGIYYIFIYKSESQRYSECIQNAGKLYDLNRKTITTNANGYTKEEQAYYYNNTDKGYIQDMDLCRNLYTK